MSAAQQKAQLPAAVDPIHRVLLIESDPQLQRFWETALTGGGFQVAIAATPNDALHLAANAAPNLVFLGTGLDGSKAVGLLEALRRMSPNLSVLAPANVDQVRQELNAMESHAAVTSASPLKVDQVKIAVTNALSFEQITREKQGSDEAGLRPPLFEEIVGASPQTQALRRAIAEAIQADPATVLILGETGTGKAVVARAIHCNGLRQKKPFVVVECTAMPAALLESELFGYEAGAFTKWLRVARSFWMKLAISKSPFKPSSSAFWKTSARAA
jgi:DNA-binding NtrC family response regulator